MKLESIPLKKEFVATSALRVRTHTQDTRHTAPCSFKVFTIFTRIVNIFSGFKLVEKCHATGQRSNCTPCPTGQFMDQMNYFSNCRPCKRCKSKSNFTFNLSQFHLLDSSVLLQLTVCFVPLFRSFQLLHSITS